jgi:uncharacterized membrane protein HdeD (DUF308 family)
MSKFSDKGYLAYRILQATFILAPILAGLDKFFFFFAKWTKYLSPFALKLLGGHHQGFMLFVGVIEIIAGLGVIFKPKLFSYIIALWLLALIINLLLTGIYYDIALRDFGLLLSVLALGCLSQKYAKN